MRTLSDQPHHLGGGSMYNTMTQIATVHTANTIAPTTISRSNSGVIGSCITGR